MRAFHPDSLFYIGISLAMTFFVLQLAVTPAIEPAVPLFPTTGHNAAEPLDVDGDGVVRGNDTALLLESLRDLADSLPLPVDEVCTPHPYLDVDGDGFLSEHDLKLALGNPEQMPSLAPAADPHSPSAMQANPVIARR